MTDLSKRYIISYLRSNIRRYYTSDLGDIRWRIAMLEMLAVLEEW